MCRNIAKIEDSIFNKQQSNIYFDLFLFIAPEVVMPRKNNYIKELSPDSPAIPH